MAENLKILTLADGFGDSHACPEWYPEYVKWPMILKFMTKKTDIIDLSRYGAGNEFIVSNLREHYQNADVILLQWAGPARLDLMMTHDPTMLDLWHKHIDSDPVYKDNFQAVKNTKWWISSGSRIPWVKDYHNRFISKTQHRNRSKIWVEYAHRLLQSKVHGFLLSCNSEYLDDVDVSPETWIWHRPWGGMDEWRHHSQYSNLDLGVTQPIPLIQFDFIKQFIMPKFDLPWRSEKEIKAVEDMLFVKYNHYKDQKPL